MHELRIALTAFCLLAAACGSPSNATPPGAPRADGVNEPGTLYVLDPNGLASDSKVIALDVATGEVARTYDAGRDPGFAVSPDGTRLYVASRSETEDTLEVIDTATGSVLQRVKLRDRWMSTLPAYVPTLRVTPDGRWVYVLEADVTGPDASGYSVATFDTHTGRLLPKSAPLPGCGGAAILPPARGARFVAVCHGSHDARFVAVSPEGAAASHDRADLARSDDERTDENGSPLDLWRVAWASAAPGAESAFAVTQNGRVSIVDANSRRVTRTEDLNLGDGSFVPFGVVESSAAGDELYAGVGSVEAPFERLTANRVLVVDTATWDQTTIETSIPFQSLVAGPSGRYVYAISTTTRSVAVVDTVLGEEVDRFEAVGASPTLGVVSPPAGGQ